MNCPYAIKSRSILFALLLAGFATLRAEEPPGLCEVVECGGQKMVVIKETKSPDGRYAIAWTLHAKGKDAKPVDWSAWSGHEGDISLFIAPYLFQEPGLPNMPYELNKYVIDLKQKKALLLPSDWPYWPHKNRGYLDVIWSPVFKDSRYLLVQNDSRFYTHNVWLVTFDGDGMKQRDLGPALHEAAALIVLQKKPATHDRYSSFFPLRGGDYGVNKDASFKSSSAAEIPFIAEIPKSIEDDSVSGSLRIHLPDGTVAKDPGKR